MTADNTTGDNSQGDIDDQNTPPQSGDTEGTGEATAPKPTEPEPFDEDRAMRTIKKQRASEEEALRRAKEAEAKVAEFQRQQMSDAEKVQADLKAAQDGQQEAERKLREMRTRQAFSERAVAEGLNPKAIKSALANVRLNLNDDGSVSNMDEAIETLKADHGYLFGSASTKRTAPDPGNTNGGDGNTPGDGPQVTSEQAEMAKRLGMSLEDYVKYVEV